MKNYKYQCEYCNKNNDKLYVYLCNKHGFHICHPNCKSLNENIESNYNFMMKKKDNQYEIIYNLILLFYKYLVSNYPKFNGINNIIIEFLIEFKEKNLVKNLFNPYTNDLNNLITKIKNNIEKDKNNIYKEDDVIKSLFIEWKKNLIKEINEIHKSKYNDLSIWYAVTRIGERIIIETNFEEYE